MNFCQRAYYLEYHEMIDKILLLHISKTINRKPKLHKTQVLNLLLTVKKPQTNHIFMFLVENFEENVFRYPAFTKRNVLCRFTFLVLMYVGIHSNWTNNRTNSKDVFSV